MTITYDNTQPTRTCFRILLAAAIIVFVLALQSCTSMYNKRSGYVGAVGGMGEYADTGEGVYFKWDNRESFKELTSLGKTYIRWDAAPSVINAGSKALTGGINALSGGINENAAIHAAVPEVVPAIPVP